MTQQNRHFYEFGDLRLDSEEGLLWRDGSSVSLTPKALELLLMFVRNPGRLLTKDELMNRVWQDSHVEEANISHQIYKLREALGDGTGDRKFIETVPRRGYRFVEPVLETNETLVASESANTLITIDEEFDVDEADRSQGVLPQNTGAAPQVGRSRRGKLLFFSALLVSLIAVAIGLVVRARHKAEASSNIHSLAVLPFRPLSAEGRDEALELGMADALITRLSNVHQIVVRPTSAIVKYTDSQADAIAAAREQNVDALIEGNVQRAGDRIRVTVQLVRTSDGASLWADTFDDQFTNVFAVQDSISERAARALVNTFSIPEQQALKKHYTDNIKAYQLYLSGRYYWSKFSPAGVARSIDYYNQAISLDPNYALAYTGLSNAYSVQGAMGITSPLESISKCRAASETALRIDDSLAEAHTSRGGLALLYEYDWPTAKRELEKSVELNPSFPDAYNLLGYYWEVMGRLDLAENEMKQGQKTGPMTPIINMDIGNLAYYEKRYDEAIRLYKDAEALDPDFVNLPFYLAQSYERRGEFDQAIAACEKRLETNRDDPALLAILGYALARAGKKAEVLAIKTKLEDMQKHRYVSPFMLAMFYAGIPDNDRAIEELNTAVVVHDPQLIWINLDPELESLHSDPRFASLLQRLHIPTN